MLSERDKQEIKVKKQTVPSWGAIIHHQSSDQTMYSQSLPHITIDMLPYTFMLSWLYVTDVSYQPSKGAWRMKQ